MAARRTPHTLAMLALVGPILLVIAALFAFSAQGAGKSEFKGRYVLQHADDFTRGKAHFKPMLELADGTLLELNYGLSHAPSVNPGSKVTIKGSRKGNTVLVAAGGTQVTGGSTMLAAGTTKRVAVVLFNFSNDTSQPYTPAFAQGVAFTNSNSVAAYYDKTSWGQLTLTGDVFGWYTIPSQNSGCNYSTWASQANTAASAAGVNLGSYTNVVYAFSSASGCGWAGLANMPGSSSWLNGPSAMGLRVMAHELGHNFGTHHASDFKCTESGVRVSLSATSSNCTAGEYGDPFTVMGMGSYEHSNFSRGNFGWLSAANTQTVTASGDYTLKPVETYAPTSVQVLRVQRTSSTYLSLELRQPSTPFDAFPATHPVVNGVLVRITPDYSVRSQSQLVDATPETTTFTDAALGVGKTLTDPLTGVSITTLSVSTAGATVRVSFSGAPPPPPPPADTSPPSQPSSFTAGAIDATRVSLSWAASTDNVAVTGYRVFRNSNLVTTVTGRAYTDTGLAASTTYAYQVVAVDAAGNASSPANASATTPSTTAPPPPPADTQPPSTPQHLVAVAGKGKKILLSWDACTDNVGVAGYRVYRDGKLIATVTMPAYSDTLGKVRSVTYSVVAFDAAGNTSAPALAAFAADESTASDG